MVFRADGEVASPIAKFLSEQELDSFREPGTTALFVADTPRLAAKVLGLLRLHLGRELDLIDRDPERLARMSVDDFMRLGGNEGAEVIMWLIMRGALDEGARKRHQNYYLPMTTAMAVALFE